MRRFALTAFLHEGPPAWRLVLAALLVLPGTAPAAADLFAHLDRNGDGSLSRAELESDESGRASWIAVDRNGDGKVTRDEFTAMSAYARDTERIVPARQADTLRGGFSAQRLIGAPARNARGEPIGEVRDLMVNRLGTITGIVIDAGGLAEPDDRLYRVAWQDAKVAPNASQVIVPPSGASAGPTRPTDRVAPLQGEWRATELLDDVVQLQAGVQYANVQDLIITRWGEVRAVVVDAGADGKPGRYAYPWPAQANAPSADRTHIRNLKPFDYGALDIAVPRQ